MPIVAARPRGLAAAAAPAGYWVNPANPTQWLSPADKAKLGSLCLAGFWPGRYRVGGNYDNSTLYCGSFTGDASKDALLFFGGGAVGAVVFLPGAWKLLALPLGALAVLGFGIGGIH